MNRQNRVTFIKLLLVFAVAGRAVAGTGPITTAFTYQGQLKQSGAAVDDLCDFDFRLFDSPTGGTQIGSTLTFDGAAGNPPPVQVVAGLLTVRLDFGVGVFTGDARWLEIRVRCPSGSGAYTILNPRQPITAAPYALFALDSPPDFNLPLAVTIDHPDTALSITNQDGGVYEAIATGLGNAGVFLVQNPDSSAPAILASSDANNAPGTIGAIATGASRAGSFRIQNGNNSAECLLAATVGLGSAGRFEIQNSVNSANTLEAITNGTGQAGWFQVNVPLAGAGTGDAVYGLTNGGGRAGFFEINVPAPANSGANALEVTTNGAGRAGLFQITAPLAATNSAPALEATTNANGEGVKAFAPNNNGVLGVTNVASTFVQGPGFFKGGVHGEGALAQGTADNFGIVGTQSSYGSGVLGVGTQDGHGVVGIPGGNNPLRTLAGVWGMTREDTNGGATWPPHFNIEGTTGPKGMVGVLGQAVTKVGVWGESIQKIGVAGTTGPATGVTPNLPVGVYGSAGIGQTTAAAGYFERRGSSSTLFNTNPSAALVATTNNAGGPAGLFLKPSAGADTFPALYAQSIGSSAAAVFQQGDAFFTSPSSGAAVRVLSSRSTGIGLDTQITNTSNSSPALQAISNSTFGNAARFLNAGTGSFDTVEIFANTTANCLLVDHSGTSGRIARFSRNAANTTGGGVEIEINGTGIALDVTHHGTGLALDMEMNPATSGLCSYIRNNHADGRALRVENNAVGGASTGAALDVAGPSNFSGPVTVIGNLCATSVCAAIKSFRIDHPLDPENKYLYHSSIESSEMLNAYSGNVVTDPHGYATVALPDWFEALNTDFRYQLTVIDEDDRGPFVLAKVVRTIHGNRFTIRTSQPLVTVSWQVTGVRHDAYARTHPLIVEVEKPEHERGKSLLPKMPGVAARSMERSSDR